VKEYLATTQLLGSEPALINTPAKVKYSNNTTTTPQPFYGPFSGTTRVSWCQKRTSGLYDAKEN